MLKKLMIGAAMSALAVSSAFAQANPSTDPPANSQQQRASSPGGGSSPTPAPGAGGSAPMAAPMAAPAGTMGSSATGGNRPGTTDDSQKAGTTDRPASTGR